MFWEAVRSGAGVLTFWQTYLAGLLFLALSIGPMFVFGLVAAKSGRAQGAIGCLSMLVLPLLQVFALVVFVLTMSPIILGVAQEPSWSFPWVIAVAAPWLLFKFVGWLFIAAFALAFIPIIGRVQSLSTLLLGSLALCLVVGLMGRANPEVAAKSIHFWPGFWFIVGLLAVGALMSWLATMLAAVASVPIEAKAEGLSALLFAPVGAALGFIPVFIYGAWLGAQIRLPAGV